MGRHNKHHLRQGLVRGQGRGRGRGQDRGRGRRRARGECRVQTQGLGREDPGPMLQIRDVGESDVGHELCTARRVEVVHKGIRDDGNPTRETGSTLRGHPFDMYAEDIGRNSRKDVDKGKDADVRFGETSNRFASQEKDMMHSKRQSRSGKRLHPDNRSPGPSFFRNDSSRSPERVRRKKQKLNVEKEKGTSADQGYHNQMEAVRRNIPPAETGSNTRQYIIGNKNVHDGMQPGTQRYSCVTPTSVQLVDSEERLRSLSTAEKEDLASLILRTVCVHCNGKTDLADLRETLHQKKVINFSNTQTLYDFVKTYDNIFKIEGDTDRTERIIEDGEVEETPAEDNFLVTGHPNLLLCQQHSKKAGSCIQDCRSLHICKYYVLSKCTMQEQGKRCIFGHDMGTEHNKEVLRKSLLHTFETEIEIDALRSLRYRNSTTVPAICNYYNKPKGCKNDECGFMHVCSKFLHGTCTASYMCNSSHDITANQPFHCLRRYGINLSNYHEKEVVQTLQSIAAEETHPAGQERQVQCSNGTQGMFAGGYKKKIPKPNKGHQVARYFAPNRFSKSEKMKVPEKLTRARNQNGQLRVEGEERGKEKEQEVSLRNSSTEVWAWSWMSAGGPWNDVTDSQIFEDRYKDYMEARKRSFVINGKMCEVDFATMTGVMDEEVALSFKRVRKLDCDRTYPPSDITDHSLGADVAGSDADVAMKTGGTDGEVASGFKSVIRPQCDTKSPLSDITDNSHVTDAAGSDAGSDEDVGTKMGVMDPEDALDVKSVAKPECDTKCPLSDITDDSHVTDVVGCDEGATTDVGKNGCAQDCNRLPSETH